MTRVLSILFLCAVSASGALNITTNAVLATFSDSFDRAQYGNRAFCYVESAYVLRHPNVTIRPRSHSRSGGSNPGHLIATEGDVNSGGIPKYGQGTWGSLRDTHQNFAFQHVSANGGLNSNSIYTNFLKILQAPTNLYDRTTNFITGASTSQVYHVVVGDIPYDEASGQVANRLRNDGATNAAGQFGYPFVQSWERLVVGVSNDFNQALGMGAWWPGSHPGNPIHLAWALTIWRDLGEVTNINSATLDWGGASVTTTSQCTVTSVSLNSAVLTFTWRAQRHAMAFDVPDGTITNDGRLAFVMFPELTNALRETITVTNVPAGNYVVAMGGTTLGTFTSQQLSNGLNLFHIYIGPLHNQKKEVLGRLRDMRGVNRADASTEAEVGNQLIEAYESNARTLWPSMTTGAAGFPELVEDLDSFQADLYTQDAVIKAAAQPTNHTFTITLAEPPPRLTGTLTFSGSGRLQ